MIASPAAPFTPIQGKPIRLEGRQLTDEICGKFGYRVAKHGSDIIEVADYVRDGTIVAQKLRWPNKQFRCVGDARGLPLFGQQLWRQGGKWIVVTEGEIDALSIAQVTDGKLPAVSVPTGAAGAVESVKQNLDYLNTFERVIFAFDMDEPGRKAALECAEVLLPGKAAIAQMPRKDANEMLVNHEVELLKEAIYNAKVFRPDNILHVSEIKPENRAAKETWCYPWDQMTDFLMGQRSREIVMWTSGTGSGKSTIIREIVAHHLEEGRTVGMIMLEESPEETLDDLVSLRLGKKVRAIRSQRELNKLRGELGRPLLEVVADDLTDEEYMAARNDLDGSHLYLYDHRGAADYNNLLNRIEYMSNSLGCKVVVLDHITAAVAGMMSDEPGSERLLIDELMKNISSLCQRHGIHVDIISQLRRMPGVHYEEGGRITADALRGSGSLGSVPDLIVALERNRQDPDKDRANTSIVRVLKNRFMGNTGVAAALRYDQQTGRMTSVDFTENPDGSIAFDGVTPSNPFELLQEMPNA